MLGWVLGQKLHFWLIISRLCGAGPKVELASWFAMQPLAVRIAMLANESSTLGHEPLPQRSLRRQLELGPATVSLRGPCALSCKAHAVPLSKGTTGVPLPKLPFQLKLREEQPSHWESGAFDNGGNDTAPDKRHHEVDRNPWQIKSHKTLLTSRGAV